MSSYLRVGAEGYVEGGLPGGDLGRDGRSPVGLPGEGPLPLPPARGRGHHPGVHHLGRLRVGDSLQVGSHGLLHGLPTDHVEPGGGHLDGPAGGHGPHEATLP